jgi:pimeloyl-ACP methyl ester carboxylesterase
MEELRLRANGIEFFALAAGPPAGPLVLLLHGFPELSRSWRHQLPALGSAGFRAVAPDLRGYGRSGGRQGPFDLPTLADDVAGLIGALGRARAAVVGHDWGGAVAWGTAGYRPEVVERLAVLDCPHPAALGRELRRNPRQLARSLYMLFFQLPWLPERLLSRHGGAAIGRALRGGSHVKAAFTWEETLPYRQAFSDPAAVKAALGYYRAAFRGLPRGAPGARGRPITVPTLVLWGRQDRFLGIETIAPDRLAPFFAPGHAPEVRLIDGAGHFLQNEAPAEVNEALLRFLGPAA